MTRRSFPLLVFLFVAAAATAAMVAQERMATGGPAPEARARLDAFIKAVNSGSADDFETMAKAHFTPGHLQRHAAADRKELFNQLRADFGTMTVGPITRRGPSAPIQLNVKGSTGRTGVVELVLETATPFRIDGLGVKVGDGSADPDAPQIPVRGKMTPAELTEALDRYLAAESAADRFSGAVLVAKNGKAIFEKAYGFADRANRLPNTPAHRFGIGSINKAFTKTAIAQLVTAGKIAYSDTLGKIIPDYPQEQTRAATIEQLLGHTAGVADFFGEAFNRAPKDQFRSNADYYRLVSSLPPLFAPGTRNQYCNGCYIVLGAIIERVSGMPYERYVAEHVFTPAGMKNAGFPQADAIEPNIATSYTRRSAGGDIRSTIYMRGAAGSAAGSAYATVADLLAFDNALRAQGLTGGNGIAGGAPGTSAVLESDGTWTVVVLTNFDPPTGERTGVAIMRALTR